MAPSPQCEPNNIELSIDEKDVAAAEPLLQLRTMDVRLLLSEKSAPSNYTNQQQGNLLPPISSLSSFNNNMLSTDPSIWALSHTHSPSPKRRCVDTNMSNTMMPAAQLLQLSKPKAKPLEPNTSLSALNTLAVSASNVLPTGAISVPIHQMTAPVHQMTAPVPVHQMVVPVHQMAAPALPSYASSSQLHYKPVFYAQQPHPAHATMILHSSPYQHHQHQYNQRLLTLPHHLSHVNTQAHPLVNQHYGVSPVQRPHPQLIAPALTGTTHILTSGLTEQSFGVMRRRSMYRPSRRLDLKCEFCGKSESPEWRRGPSGPNTLCNACGIKYAKKRKIVPEPAATTTASVVEAK